MAILSNTEILNAIYNSSSTAIRTVMEAGSSLIGKVAVTGKAATTGDTEITAVTAGADAISNTSNRLAVSGWLQAFNGTTWDRIRSGAVSNVAAATGFLNSLSLGRYNATPPTLTDTYYNALQLDSSGNLKVTIASLMAGEDQTFNRINTAEAYSSTNITTQTTTTVKSGAGRLQRIVIPTPVANATVKIYDNTAASGTVLLDTITFPGTLLSSGPVNVPLGVAFSTGCTIVTAGATMTLVAVYI